MERFLWICLAGAAGTDALPYRVVNGATVRNHIPVLPILDEMLTGGALVTTEPVRVLKYAARDSARAPVPGGS